MIGNFILFYFLTLAWGKHERTAYKRLKRQLAGLNQSTCHMGRRTLA
jgi:hypothetical protein